jgi:hypothetical protein
MKKYALAVQVDPSGIFEVYEILSVPDSFPRIQAVWSDGLSKGVPSLIHVSGVSGISSGDGYVAGEFITNSETNSVDLSDEIEVFACVSNSTVYGYVSVEANTFVSAKYLAATEGENIVFDSTGDPTVVLGAMWDGTKVISG